MGVRDIQNARLMDDDERNLISNIERGRSHGME